MNSESICFVLSPFGKKSTRLHRLVDFDSIWWEAVHPGIEDAGLTAVRADFYDLHMASGILLRAYYERILLSPFCVADVTTSSPYALYGLGIRHAVRPASTLVLQATADRAPFDVAALGAIVYEVGANGQLGVKEAEYLRTRLAESLQELRKRPIVDSPLFQALRGYSPPDISGLESDLLRDRRDFTRRLFDQLARARLNQDEAEVIDVESMIDIGHVESELLEDLLATYRVLGSWQRIVDLFMRLPEHTRDTVGVTRGSAAVIKQVAYAYSRLGNWKTAVALLKDWLDRETDPEAWAILGNLYQRLSQDNQGLEAAGWLDRAVDAYERGFEASEFSDPYLGLTLVRLLIENGGKGEEVQGLATLVRGALTKWELQRKGDSWTESMALEIAFIQRDQTAANKALRDLGTNSPGELGLEVVCRSLSSLEEILRERGESEPWMQEIVNKLERFES